MSGSGRLSSLGAVYVHGIAQPAGNLLRPEDVDLVAALRRAGKLEGADEAQRRWHTVRQAMQRRPRGTAPARRREGQMLSSSHPDRGETGHPSGTGGFV